MTPFERTIRKKLSVYKPPGHALPRKRHAQASTCSSICSESHRFSERVLRSTVTSRTKQPRVSERHSTPRPVSREPRRRTVERASDGDARAIPRVHRRRRRSLLAGVPGQDSTDRVCVGEYSARMAPMERAGSYDALYASYEKSSSYTPELPREVAAYFTLRPARPAAMREQELRRRANPRWLKR